MDMLEKKYTEQLTCEGKIQMNLAFEAYMHLRTISR